MDEIREIAEHILKAIELYKKEHSEGNAIYSYKNAVEDAATQISTGFDTRIDNLILILIKNSPGEAAQWATKMLKDPTNVQTGPSTTIQTFPIFEESIDDTDLS